jgi:hypothetical protein
MAEKYDWDNIRNEYVMGIISIDPKTGRRKHTYPTHQNLVDKYGMNLRYLQEKSMNEFWSKRRSAFKAKARNKIVDWQLGAFLSESAQLDAMTVDKLKKVHQVIDLYLLQALNPTEDDKGNIQMGVTPQELKSITDVLEKCQKLMRLSNNEPTDMASVYKELRKELLGQQHTNQNKRLPASSGYNFTLDIDAKEVPMERKLDDLEKKERLLEKEIKKLEKPTNL